MRNYPETLLQDIVLADNPARQTEIEKLTKIYQKENSDGRITLYIPTMSSVINTSGLRGSE